MKEIISAVFIVLGTLFIFISALGILRMPDLFMRMSATTKTATLGVGFILLGTAIHFWEIGIFSRAMIIISFLMLTAPVAAHMIGRAAYFNDVPLWKGTRHDELKGKYDNESHELKS
ncbi:MAG: monovalent cation/H(+) antiporter subunit G [Ignavibacteriae bacterium]|nr:monovalent cation/H(+) antiporter subunit G [Ignavibacteriota bacterium]NOG97853.1 monovalent cation/H(+) antiporter subunit G [Ignavibacteriota bacterium]